MSRHLVLGANGYLGSHVARRLLELGHDVIASGRRPESAHDLPNYISVDLAHADAIEQVPVDVDFVWNFAARTGTWAGFDSPALFVHENELVVLNLLTAIKASSNRPRVLFPSTRLVYRGSSQPLVESSEQASLTVYAQSKRSCEEYLSMYGNAFNIPSTVFRIGVLFGSRDERAYSYSTIGAMLARAYQGLPLTVYGTGAQRRTFTHIDDATSDMIDVSTREETLVSTYNVGGESLSVADVARLIADRFKLPLSFSEWPDAHRRIESGDTVFDATKLDSLLGSRPRTAMRDWIQGIV